MLNLAAGRKSSQLSRIEQGLTGSQSMEAYDECSDLLLEKQPYLDQPSYYSTERPDPIQRLSHEDRL